MVTADPWQPSRQLCTAQSALFAKLDETCGIRPTLYNNVTASSPTLSPLSPVVARSIPGGRLPTLPVKTHPKEEIKRGKPNFNAYDNDKEDTFEVDPYANSDMSWSDEVHKLRLTHQQFYSKHQRATESASSSIISYQPFSKSFLLSFFKTLRLNDMKIEHVDLEALTHLREVVLMGNEIKILHARSLPPSLEALNISVNRKAHKDTRFIDRPIASSALGMVPSRPTLSTNRDETERTVPLRPVTAGIRDTKTSQQAENLPSGNHAAVLFPMTLISLDISFCDILDFNNTLRALQQLRCLKLLNMTGNPFSLLEKYRPFSLTALPNLFALDDLEITDAERAAAGTPIPEMSNEVPDGEVLMRFTVGEMTGLSAPPPIEHRQSPSEPDEPPDEYLFSIQLRLGRHQKARFSTESHIWQPEALDYAFTSDVQFGVDLGLRDAFIDGLYITLHRKRITHKLREGVQAASRGASKTPSREASRPTSGKGTENTIIKKPQASNIAVPAKSSSRPTTPGNRPTTPAKRANGAVAGAVPAIKGAAAAEALWMKVVMEDVVLGRAQISLRDIFDGQTNRTGDFHMESDCMLRTSAMPSQITQPPSAVDASELTSSARPTTASIAATVRVGLKMHPAPRPLAEPEPVAPIISTVGPKKGVRK
ncbi:hypothetical protein SeMB42_g01950 [Synchytrium endobioticum]|uniref:Uncharacterized protein n=1 Tax=Synchytrium endobioticum TaxID=286115 RepID=A0A507DKD2_9FUNG|nr:hypothetical protein SeLEV6574_g03679 [Synchytrium endobioticum]TPX51340.1 hypothetical protein SeMB42_g01950 [Synchytrium endobioticum]